MQVGLMLTKLNSYRKSNCVISNNNPCKITLLFFMCKHTSVNLLREGDYVREVRRIFLYGKVTRFLGSKLGTFWCMAEIIALHYKLFFFTLSNRKGGCLFFVACP